MATRCPEDVFSTPKFFKIIADPLANLVIPDAFMKRHGRNLRKRVFLKVPNRVWWEVELIHSNGETVLQKGWKEFREHYSLGFGHFLVFEYNGHSQFDVLIFDKSASEIDYPSGSDIHVEGSGTKSDDSVGVLDYLSSRKRKQKTVEDSDTHVPQIRIKLEESSYYTGDRVPKRQTTLAKETSRAYQKALAYAAGPTFRSPFFLSLMQPSYVAAKFGLNVPVSFAKENMPCGNTTVTVRVKDDEKNAWSIKFHYNLDHAKMSSGWSDFVKDNGLRVGDACIFQVVNGFHWNVIIFKS